MPDFSDAMRENQYERERADLLAARDCYFKAGGVESDIGPRDSEWYWRRAALLWRDRAERYAIAVMRKSGE